MQYDLLAAFVLFAFVSSITPGPNNLMLMASEANFGFRRTVPHMLGVGIGFSVMIVLVGVGLIQLFDRWPVLYTVLKVVSVLYLTWLAYRIARAGTPEKRKAGGKPMNFLQAAAFQWVNPKAWAMALTAISAYAPDHSLWTIALISAIFGAINIPSISTWVVMGQQIRRWLTSPARLHAFNWTMAGLLILSLVPVIFHGK